MCRKRLGLFFDVQYCVGLLTYFKFLPPPPGQACCVSRSTRRSTSSRCRRPTPAPSSPCPGWNWEGKSPSTAPRAATRPLSRSTPSLSMAAKYTGGRRNLGRRSQSCHCSQLNSRRSAFFDDGLTCQIVRRSAVKVATTLSRECPSTVTAEVGQITFACPALSNSKLNFPSEYFANAPLSVLE